MSDAGALADDALLDNGSLCNGFADSALDVEFALGSVVGGCDAEGNVVGGSVVGSVDGNVDGSVAAGAAGSAANGDAGVAGSPVDVVPFEGEFMTAGPDASPDDS